MTSSNNSLQLDGPENGVPIDIKQAPTADFIAGIRRRFPTEPEVDRVLSRKMEMRAKSPYLPVSFTQMTSCLKQLLNRELDKPFTIENARWMTGGSSKLQMGFDLSWHGMTGQGMDGTMDRHTTALVLRMSPAESTVESSRRREFEIINALADTIPVPKCYWEDELMEIFPYPVLIFGFAEGVTKPTSEASGKVTDLGLNFGPKLRPKVTDEFMRGMGKFHTADASALDLKYFKTPQTGSNAGIIAQVNMWRRIWAEDCGEENPLVHIAGNWLEDNAPVLDHVSIIHGDCRSGNFLIDESDGRITAWLDWELAVLGDRHQDLTWATSAAYAHLAEDGKTMLVNGMLPIDEFYAAYEKTTGLSVDPQRIKYYRVYNALVSVVVCMASAHRAAKGGKSHQDIVMTWLNGISGLLTEQLRQTLLEVLS